MRKRGNPEQGFSLIELMLAIVVLAILLGIAWPNYQTYVQKSKRVELQAHLMSLSQQLASYRLVNQSFAGATLPSLSVAAQFPSTGTPDYQLQLTDLTGRLLTEVDSQTQTWLLVATPALTSRQHGTGKITLNHREEKCWYTDQDDAVVSATDAEHLTPCPATWQH